MSTSQQYCLRWNNHRSNMLTVFGELLHNAAFTDVTLAVDCGEAIECHKIVLAACSTYFQHLFHNIPNQHPIVILKDVKYSEIKAILEYMYRGEVNVAQDQLSGLLKVAQMLKVKGLVEEHGGRMTRDVYRDDAREMSTSPPPAISTSTGGGGGSGSHPSPPHSTCDYSSLYGKSSLDRPSHLIPGTLPITWSSLMHAGMGHQLPTSLSSSTTNAVALFASGGGSGGGGGASYDNGIETSPHKLRRKLMQPSPLLMNNDTPILRTVLGQAHVDSSQSIMQPLLQPDSHEMHEGGHYHRNASSNGSANDTDTVGSRRSGNDLTHSEASVHASDVPYVDEDDRQTSPQSYGDTLRNSGSDSMSSFISSAIPTYFLAALQSGNCLQNFALSEQTLRADDRVKGAMNQSQDSVQPKPEWKRYKQYTRDDITGAINAVRGGMSAVAAARKYGVPSRTLYDKVKKLGIPTSRPFKRSTSSNGGSGACFPYGIGANVNGALYDNSGGGGSANALPESENDGNANAEGLAGTSAAASFEAFAKGSTKDTQDRDAMSDSLARSSLSPVIRCAKPKQQLLQQPQDDEVEDLSVSRKSDVPVIVPPSTTSIVKEEKETGLDNNDCCDYS